MGKRVLSMSGNPRLPLYRNPEGPVCLLNPNPSPSPVLEPTASPRRPTYRPGPRAVRPSAPQPPHRLLGTEPCTRARTRDHLEGHGLTDGSADGSTDGADGHRRGHPRRRLAADDGVAPAPLQAVAGGLTAAGRPAVAAAAITAGVLVSSGGGGHGTAAADDKSVADYTGLPHTAVDVSTGTCGKGWGTPYARHPGTPGCSTCTTPRRAPPRSTPPTPIPESCTPNWRVWLPARPGSCRSTSAAALCTPSSA